MNIEDRIDQVFQAENISDQFIEENPNIMELRNEPDLLSYVSAYMIWCVRHKDRALVDMYTVGCLAEYGRCKDPGNDYLNFKHRCTDEQKKVVHEFLQWCSSEILTSDTMQIERALKNWRV